MDYKINQLKSDNKLGINDDDIVALGMTYQSDYPQTTRRSPGCGFFLAAILRQMQGVAVHGDLRVILLRQTTRLIER